MSKLLSVRYTHETRWDLFMFGIFLVLIAFAYLYEDLNYAHGLGALGRALYVDEGFYSDAAQNLVKTGRWGVPHDARHWPGSPLTVVFQSVAFWFFGATTTVARLLSVLLSVIGAAALYSIAKTRFTPAISAWLTLASITTITFLVPARTAITDPTAMSMSLLAMWSFVRLENRQLALPLSLVFAFLAFFSKMYFLFAIATLIAAWLGELVLVPVLNNRQIDWRSIRRMVFYLLVIGGLYYLYRLVFQAAISDYMAINANKKPVLDLGYLYVKLVRSLYVLPMHIRGQYVLIALGLGVLWAIGRTTYTFIREPLKDAFAYVLAALSRVSRAEWVMALFLVSGIITVGSLRLHKSHYHLFAIIPFVFLAVAIIHQQLPRKIAGYVAGLVLFAHMAYQVPFYQSWLKRPNPTSIADASRSIVDTIHAAVPEGNFAVLGEYSSQLGLYSERVISIDARWIPHGVLCQRIDYWRPPFHVNVYWRGGRTAKIVAAIKACPQVQDVVELDSYPTFRGLQDRLVLRRIDYVDN